MKLFIFLFFFTTFRANSQTLNIKGKNIIHYKADKISSVLVQNYDDLDKTKQNEIFNKTWGIEVNIYVDTTFKKYTIIYKDENNKLNAMIYSYIKDYFGGKDNDGYKMYLMKDHDMFFFLIDFLQEYALYSLEIRYEKRLANNATLFYKIEDAKLVP